MTTSTNTLTAIVNNSTVITVSNLVDLLKATTKSTVAHIIYQVDHAQSKTVLGEKQIQKLVEITHLYLNHDYTKKVQNLTGEKFVAQPLENFGKTRICSTIVASLKSGAMMIDGKVLNSATANILSLSHMGNEITEAEAIAKGLFAPSYFKPKNETTKGRGTVAEADDFAIVNTTLTKIKHIKLSGKWYTVA